MSRSQSFGHYDLLDRVNVGGMAEIFRARSHDTGAICAVKRILPEIAEDDEFVRMFADEAKIAALLEHPNICRILDIGRVDRTYYLALELVEGVDLRVAFDRAAQKQDVLPVELSLHAIMRVCEGLEYAHQKKDASGAPLHLVHRDVSPQNVLLGFDGSVKLIDFGIAKSAGKLSQTQVGTIKGKYGYMSPEQARGLPLDPRSDIFSLGICLYELLTGRRMFAADNELLVMERIKEADFPPPSSIVASTPLALDRIVMRALARDVDDRYRSAEDFGRALQAFAELAGLEWHRDRVAAYVQSAFADVAVAQGESPPAVPAPRATITSATNGHAGAENRGSAHSSPYAPPQGPPPMRPPPPHMINGRPHEPPSEPSLPGDPTEVLSRSALPSGLGASWGVRASTVSAREEPGATKSAQEQLMSENKGSDLDVFEGLSAKRPESRRPSTAAPPPPPPSRSLPPPPPVRRAATQMGIGAPPMSQRSSGATPPIAPPPTRSPVPPAPPQRSAAPANARSQSVDMDWDDDEEKTHVYDKEMMKDAMPASRGQTAPQAVVPPLKATMIGLASPMPPPPPKSRVSDRPPASAPMQGTLPAPAAPPMSSASPHLPSPVPPSLPPLPAAGAATPPPPDFGAVFAPATAPESRSPGSGPRSPSVPPPSSAPRSASVPPPLPPHASSAAAAAPTSAPGSAPARPHVVDRTQELRPHKGGSSLGLVVAGLGLAVCAAVGGYFWASSRPGNVLVNVDLRGPKDVIAKVSLDGTLRCSDTTCRIEGVPSGAHSIKVIAGDVEKRVTITVEPGKDTVVPVQVEVAAKKTGLKLASTQPGLKVEIDGGAPRALPVDDDAMKPGVHKLKFTGPGERFRTKELEVSLDEGGTKTIEDVKLPLKSVRTKFAFATKGAKATLSDGTKKIELKDDGQPIELDTSKPWTLAATAANADDLSMPLRFGDDGDQTVEIKLPDKAKPAAATVAAAHVPVHAPVHAPVESAPAAAAAPAAATGGDGSLFVNTLPKSNCVVNGMPRGSTPMTLKLAPGNYSVTCVAKDGDDVLKKSGSATVKGGETAKVVLRLRD